MVGNEILLFLSTRPPNSMSTTPNINAEMREKGEALMGLDRQTEIQYGRSLEIGISILGYGT